MDRCTFETLLNVLRPAVTRENTKLPDCIAQKKYSHFVFIVWRTRTLDFKVGRSTVLEAVQDVVEDLVRPHLQRY